MAAPMSVPSEFDPLVEFYGMWNTRLAESYLPLPLVRAAKYECLGGYLIMSPYEGSTNSYGEWRFAELVGAAVRRAGLHPYSTVNMLFADNTWIQPDLTILREPAHGATWVPAAKVLMPVEFVSVSSRRRDRIDKPALCAEAGVPWYCRVELDYPNRTARVLLYRLDGNAYVEHAAAVQGERCKTTEPFELDFDPAELLEPP